MDNKTTKNAAIEGIEEPEIDIKALNKIISDVAVCVKSGMSCCG